MIEEVPITVDLNKAWEKMGESCLTTPNEYVLALLRSAISQHAGYFHVNYEHSGYTFSFDGKGYSEQVLSNLPSFLFARDQDDETQISYQYFARGIAAALNTDNTTHITILSPQDQDMIRLTLKPGKANGLEALLEHVESQQQTETKVTVHRNKALQRGCKSLLTDTQYEPDILQTMACNVPLLLTINKKDVSRPLEKEVLSRSFLQHYFEYGSAKGVIGILENPEKDQSRLVLQREGIAFHHGLSLNNGLEAIVEHPGLRADISERSVVFKDAHAEVCQAILHATSAVYSKLREAYVEGTVHRRKAAELLGWLLSRTSLVTNKPSWFNEPLLPILAESEKLLSVSEFVQLFKHFEGFLPVSSTYYSIDDPKKTIFYVGNKYFSFPLSPERILLSKLIDNSLFAELKGFSSAAETRAANLAKPRYKRTLDPEDYFVIVPFEHQEEPIDSGHDTPNYYKGEIGLSKQTIFDEETYRRYGVELSGKPQRLLETDLVGKTNSTIGMAFHNAGGGLHLLVDEVPANFELSRAVDSLAFRQLRRKLPSLRQDVYLQLAERIVASRDDTEETSTMESLLWDYVKKHPKFLPDMASLPLFRVRRLQGEKYVFLDDFLPLQKYVLKDRIGDRLFDDPIVILPKKIVGTIDMYLWKQKKGLRNCQQEFDRELRFDERSYVKWKRTQVSSLRFPKNRVFYQEQYTIGEIQVSVGLRRYASIGESPKLHYYHTGVDLAVENISYDKRIPFVPLIIKAEQSGHKIDRSGIVKNEAQRASLEAAVTAVDLFSKDLLENYQPSYGFLDSESIVKKQTFFFLVLSRHYEDDERFVDILPKAKFIFTKRKQFINLEEVVERAAQDPASLILYGGELRRWQIQRLSHGLDAVEKAHWLSKRLDISLCTTKEEFAAHANKYATVHGFSVVDALSTVTESKPFKLLADASTTALKCTGVAATVLASPLLVPVGGVLYGSYKACSYSASQLKELYHRYFGRVDGLIGLQYLESFANRDAMKWEYERKLGNEVILCARELLNANSSERRPIMPASRFYSLIPRYAADFDKQSYVARLLVPYLITALVDESVPNKKKVHKITAEDLAASFAKPIIEYHQSLAANDETKNNNFLND